LIDFVAVVSSLALAALKRLGADFGLDLTAVKTT
jgi:hypothetical protein